MQNKQIIHLIQKRWCHHIPAFMRCLKFDNYANSVSQLNVSFEAACPREKLLKPDQALVKVCASSINPFDIEMSRGFGRNLINALRQCTKTSEFPLILGRDCSGVIVKRGKRFRRFGEGDHVYCARWVVGQGTHAEFVIVNKSELSLKPNNLTDIEAASFPYVACTTWNALINSGAVPINSSKKLRIFIPGGTGGVGAFAIQLCQAYGHDVVTSCSTDGIERLRKLDIHNVLDYTSRTFEHDLRCAGPFDVILDTVDEKDFRLFSSVMSQNSSSKYISLRPSFLPDIDEQGLTFGTLMSGAKYMSSNLVQLSKGHGLYHWGFFKADGSILENIRPLIEEGKIKPFIDKVFNIDQILDAYKYVEKGHARGKTMIEMK